VFIRLNQQLT